MNHEQVMDILSGRRRGAGASALRAALAGASLPYAAAMRLRRWAYRAGALPSRAAGVPVISVGNITTGGTGKTPMVAWLVGQLKQMNRKPAVLTRGYKSEGGRSDEAELLRQMTGAAVIVNAARLAGAAAAIAGGADVLVMDDGFQHRRLRRDLDIVLIDATNPFGFGHCLPRGLLREPPSALADADAIIITRADAARPEEFQHLRGQLAKLAPRASLHMAAHRPKEIADPAGAVMPVSVLAGRKILAFCGLGNPQQFFDMLARLGADVAATVAFDDHAAYSPADLDAIRRRARQCNADVLVTTAKDRVKFPLTWSDRPVWTLIVNLDIIDGRDELMRQVAGILAGK
jgi:tetraacyldisaccharide 4'-kinase